MSRDISEYPFEGGEWQYMAVVRDDGTTAIGEMIAAARASGKLGGVYSWIDDHDVLHSPDCRDGKHRSCTGAGWDLTADIGTDCPCKCHNRRA